jgi:serine protease AprX
MNTVEINGNEKALGSSVAEGPFAIEAPPVARSDYILVKFAGPLTAEQVQALDKADVKLLERTADGVYLAGYKPDTLDPVTNGLSNFVEHAEVFHPGYVVEPSLRTGDAQHVTKVSLSLHDDVEDANAVREAEDKIARVLDIPSSEVNIEDGSVDIDVPQDKLDQLAGIDEVKAINRFHEPRLSNNQACKIVDAHTSTKIGANTTTYKGKGQIVCVADTGFDTGDRQNCHAAFEDRVQQVISVGRLKDKSQDSSNKDLCYDPDGHGTHVCGSVLGKGTHSVEGVIEAPASEAHLIVQSLFTTWSKKNKPRPEWEAGLASVAYPDLFNTPYNAGARIHTNSWGSGSSAEYTTAESASIDDYLWGKKDLVVLFAAGNDGMESTKNEGRVAEGSLGEQAVAKNW